MRKLHALILALGLGLVFVAPVYAMDAAPAEDVPAEVEKPAEDKEEAKDEVAKPNEEKAEDGSNADLLDKGKDVISAVKEIRNAPDDTPRKILIAALIAALANLLLSGVKRWKRMSDRGKKFIPWMAAGLGGVVGVATYIMEGNSLFDSIFYGGAALGSIVMQELGLGPIPSKKDEDEEEEDDGEES